MVFLTARQGARSEAGGSQGLGATCSGCSGSLEFRVHVVCSGLLVGVPDAHLFHSSPASLLEQAAILLVLRQAAVPESQMIPN